MVEGPRSEDGEPLVLLQWFVLAEDNKGRRWAYAAPDGQWEPSRGHEPPAAAEALKAKFEAELADPSLGDDWVEDLPRYGSEAWDDEAEYNLACEEADALGTPRPER
jgi:hypothetical protein